MAESDEVRAAPAEPEQLSDHKLEHVAGGSSAVTILAPPLIELPEALGIVTTPVDHDPPNSVA